MRPDAWRSARRWLLGRRVGLFLCLLGFLWGIALLNMAFVGDPSTKSSEELRDEILALSERYVKTLAEENQDVIDGPYAGRLTGYDLKKTLAVLLENMLGRLARLEQRVDGAVANLSRPAAGTAAPPRRDGTTPPPPLGRADDGPPVHAQDLVLGAQEDCTLTDAQRKADPHCEGKIAWMRAHWKSDACYAQYGVDGTECSFRVYLSEVESWCPLLPGRRALALNHTQPAIRKASLNLELSGLLAKLEDPGQRPNYDWMRVRITRMWPNWVAAARRLREKQPALSDRQQKKALVHLGLLSKKSGFKIAETSFKGGPLGELVQWSDIISALYVLGHQLTITSEVDQLAGIINKLPTAESQCQNRDRLPIDMIFSDIVGLSQFKRKVRSGYGKFSCLLRIIDSFGTEPAFNYDVFAKQHRLKTQWGMQNLDPRQFFTMFPHSPDNSFMGFVVEQHLNDSQRQQPVSRQDRAVVYGKAQYMWQGRERYLGLVREFVEVHGTVFVEAGEQSTIPGYVHNHGILPGPQLHQLLRESKIFLGLGFPYEGPAPLEAIAQGNIFINPKFNPPHNSDNTKFFKGKPTKRKLTSQHPYAEDFIGEPHVLTVDVADEQAVRNAIKRALELHRDGKVAPYMPYEYTEEGMLQRLDGYLANQDFCRLRADSAPWPPPADVSVLLAQPGQSCKDACWDKDLICEPSHFARVNNESALGAAAGQRCSSLERHEDIMYPAYAGGGRCVLQAHPLLFSCVGEGPGLRRLCPCRTYIKGQTALCRGCL